MVSSKQPGTRVPAGVFVGVFMAVLVILAVVLFSLAARSGPGPNGRTTSGPAGGVVVLLSSGPPAPR